MKWICVILFVAISVSFSYSETDGRFIKKENSFSSILEPISHLTGILSSGILNKGDDYCDDVYKYPKDLPADATLAAYGDLKFTGFQFAYKTKLIIINGIPEYYLEHERQILVSGGGLKGVYYLHKLSHYNPPQHTVAGARYNAEVHITCINEKYDDYESASEHPDGLAIFVSFAIIGSEENLAHEQFLDALMHVEGDPPSYELITKFSPSVVLPENRCSFFRYRGRHSHHSCKEIATWTVFTDPIEVTENQHLDMADQLLTIRERIGPDFTNDNKKYNPNVRIIDIDNFKSKKHLVTLQPRIFCKSPLLYKEGFPWFLFYKHH